jgi:tetratricopeptide (TPR) repeat protein
MPVKSFSKLTRGYRRALLRHQAFVANNLGVALDEQNMPELAFASYEKALELYPDNISALLNQFELISRGLYPEKRDLIEKQMHEKVANATDQYPLWALNRHFGYVRNYELFVNMGWDWAISSSPSSVIAGLRRTFAVEDDVDRRNNLTAVIATVYEMQGEIVKSRSYYETMIAENPRDTQAISGLVRLSLQDGGVNAARLVLERGQENGVSSLSLRKDWAALYLMVGDLPKARTILQAMTDEHGANSMAIAMLAMVMIEQGEFSSVESKILPELIKMEKSEDNYFVHVIQGRIYQMKGKIWYSKARKQFIRAYALRPDVAALKELIFRLDVAMEDRAAAEAHAIEILRAKPNHAMANFFMGSVALEAGEYGKAEGYLKRSVEDENPSVEALNNYAQLLCRIKRNDEAVKVARRATKLAPDRYEVWSTLAYILQDVDQLDEASKALITASKINKSDKRLFIIDGLISFKRGDLSAVKRAVEAVGKESEHLPITSQRDLAILKKALSL